MIELEILLFMKVIKVPSLNTNFAVQNLEPYHYDLRKASQYHQSEITNYLLKTLTFLVQYV